MNIKLIEKNILGPHFGREGPPFTKQRGGLGPPFDEKTCRGLGVGITHGGTGGGRLYSSVAQRPKFRVILTTLGHHTHGDEAGASHMVGRKDFIARSRGAPS